MLTHYNMIAHARQRAKVDVRLLHWELDSQIGILPFFHIYVSTRTAISPNIFPPLLYS